MTLADASALVALINASDNNHKRCLSVLPDLQVPLITTWCCFTEAMYLLGRYGGWFAQRELWVYLNNQIVLLHFNSEREQSRMQLLMAQYKDLPMDLADASLVAAAETLDESQVFTLDKDFYVYRFLDDRSFEVIPAARI